MNHKATSDVLKVLTHTLPAPNIHTGTLFDDLFITNTSPAYKDQAPERQIYQIRPEGTP